MPAFEPRPEDLPRDFPVFPLPGALLLPRGKLPLNIFEPRYLAMTEDALGAGRVFGMIQPDPRLPEGPNGPGLYRVGCLGRLVSFSETDDGRYLITLLGLSRFAVSEELPMRRGYRRVQADFSPFLADLAAVADAAAGYDRAALLQALRAYFGRRRHRGELGGHQPDARPRAGGDAQHGLPVRCGGKAGAAGSGDGGGAGAGALRLAADGDARGAARAVRRSAQPAPRELN